MHKPENVTATKEFTIDRESWIQWKFERLPLRSRSALPDSVPDRIRFASEDRFPISERKFVKYVNGTDTVTVRCDVLAVEDGLEHYVSMRHRIKSWSESLRFEKHGAAWAAASVFVEEWSSLDSGPDELTPRERWDTALETARDR